MPEAARLRAEIRGIETGEIGTINHEQEALRLRAKGLERKGITAGPEMDAIERELAALHSRYKTQEARLTELRKQQGASLVVDGGRRQGEGAAARPGARRLLPQRHGAAREGVALCDAALGVRVRRAAGVEHRGGRVPGHLRHRDDGRHHEHPGDAARRARRLLPAGVRQAGAVRERGPDRGEQPGRGALDRVRGLRRRLLHLLRRRDRSTGSSTRMRCPPRPTGRAGSSGPRSPWPSSRCRW